MGIKAESVPPIALRLIVRPRVYAALKPLKLRGVRWFPARVE